MTSRERIRTALSHREPDRIPFDLGSTPVTGIHSVACQRLRRAMGLPDRDPVIFHAMQQLAWVEEDLHGAMQTDARGLRPKPPSAWRMEETEDAGFRYYTDEWGISRRMPKEGGYYFDLCGSPLAGAETPADIARHPWPSPDEEARFAGMREQAEQIRADGRALVLGGIGSGMMELGQALRGFENLYCDMAANRTLAEALFEKVLELRLRYWEQALMRLGDLADVVQEGDDYGGQHGLLISAQTWRALLKPRLRQLFAAIKRQAPHVRIFFHSCGSLRAILPDLIEVGVDILNPVQVTAAGMESRALKRDFGDALTFWGGGVDTQRVLPRGTPQQVRDEVKRRIEDLAPGGGFVFAAVHNIQADVPPENVLAMRAAVNHFNNGGHGGTRRKQG